MVDKTVLFRFTGLVPAVSARMFEYTVQAVTRKAATMIITVRHRSFTWKRVQINTVRRLSAVPEIMMPLLIPGINSIRECVFLFTSFYAVTRKKFHPGFVCFLLLCYISAAE